MRIRNEVVAAINAALTSNDRVLLIEQEIMNGCTLQEIVRAFAGSKWRFHLLKTGLRIAIADIEELHRSYRTELDALRTMCSALRVQDRTISEPGYVFRQIRIRTEVARQARKITLVETHVNRFLSNLERLNADGGDPITAILEGFGFKWVGADIVLELDPGEHPVTRKFVADRDVAQTGTNPWTESGDDAKVLANLNYAASSNSAEHVFETLDLALQAVPLRDIAGVLENTEIRYEILGSGKSFKIQMCSTLSTSFTDLCGEVFEYKEELGVDDPKADYGFRSLNIREPLGVACRELAIEADRLNRYLLPTEQHLDAGDFVVEFLKGTAFRWNGGYEVERFDGENKQLLDEAIAYYCSPAVAAAAGPR